MKPSIPALVQPRGGLVVAPAEKLKKPHSWALSLTASSVMGSLSLLCLVSLCVSNSLAFRTFVLLHMYAGVDSLCVSSISKEGSGYY